MTDEEFAQIMALPRESSGVEFKGPGSLRGCSRLVAQVVKAVLGMSNRRDGGSVIIGVRDDGGALTPSGITDDDLPSWTHDAVADQIARYADPSVNFQLDTKEYEGNKYVILEVAEFPDIPVLCKRAFDGVLREGACYVRTRRKPETTEIPAQAEMRDLLDLAIEKGVRQFLERAARVGLSVPQNIEPVASDQERFDEQVGDLK